MKKILKQVISIAVISIVFLSMSQVLAAPVKPDAAKKLNTQTDALSTSAGFEIGGVASVGGIVATVIKGALSLLGVIFIIIIVLAGFRWMMASGNEEIIAKAKSTLKNVIIGLAVVLAAYAITDFVFYEFDWVYQGTPPSAPGIENPPFIDSPIDGGSNPDIAPIT